VPSSEIERRKADHLRVAAEHDVDTRRPAGWEDVHLVHQALPVTDLAAVDLSTELLGHRLRAPLLVAGMTGGHPAAHAVNQVLARAAERHGLAMGVGSQRAALDNPDLAYTYAVVRQSAPGAMVIANLGAAQLVPQPGRRPLGAEHLLEAVAMVRADALAIHLNFLEELVQPEGDRQAAGLREAITRSLSALPVPAIAKETGAGLSRETALELRRLGFSALDVGGLGGTSFAALEGLRAVERGDAHRARLGETLRDWGLPTAVSILGARAAGLPMIATGGVRTGLDAAKAIALGATLVGVARPLLAAALESEEAVERWIEVFLDELRSAVFLTGGSRVGDLAAAPRVILGDTAAWAQALGYGS
jgi:isopentenyl-diphosphate delta-isomerase